MKQIYLKTREMEINIRGRIPGKLETFLKKEFGKKLNVIQGDQKAKQKLTPAEALLFYRKHNKMSQKELGEKLGNIPKQHISNMEKGVRNISVANAKKLSEIFQLPFDTFL